MKTNTSAALTVHCAPYQDNHGVPDSTGDPNHTARNKRQHAGPEHVVTQAAAADFDLSGVFTPLQKWLDQAHPRKIVLDLGGQLFESHVYWSPLGTDFGDGWIHQPAFNR